MIPNSHPYWLVRSIIEQYSDIAAVPVSYYTYQPQAVADCRTTWLIPTEEFLDPQRVLTVIENTPAGQEMAVHSDLRLHNGQRLHLVMIDMSTASEAHLEKLRVFLGDNFFQTISWFASGRSFHGYGGSLLLESDWVKFMGLLLLANQPRLKDTVDPRWVGHRLLAGYASLRWTKNTHHYLGLPTRVGAKIHQTDASLKTDSSGKRLSTGRKTF